MAVRYSISAKIASISAISTVLIIASCLAHNSAIQIAIVGIAQVFTISLLGTSILRANARLALRSQDIRQLQDANRAKASIKEYEILTAIKAGASREVAAMDNIRLLEKRISQLTNELAESNKVAASLNAEESKSSLYQTNSELDHEKNRLAIQQLLTRLIGTQDDIARRLNGIESWAAKSSGGYSEQR